MYTTLKQVKDKMGWSLTETQHDVLIEGLILAAESRVNMMAGTEPHGLDVTTWTEHRSGGNPSIILDRHPIVSITTLHDDPAHEFDATSLVASTDYFISDAAAGIVMMKVGCFLHGKNNVKVVYEGGWEVVPAAVTDLVTTMCVARVKSKGTPELMEQVHRDGRVTRWNMKEWDDRIRRVLEPLGCL
jgi:hypothetical protein